jgi:hypothetical protein
VTRTIASPFAAGDWPAEFCVGPVFAIVMNLAPNRCRKFAVGIERYRYSRRFTPIPEALFGAWFFAIESAI